MVKHLLISAAVAALTAGSAMATVKIGDTTYNSIQAAVDAAQTGDIISISGEETVTGRINFNREVVFNVTGEEGAVIKNTGNAQIALINGKATVNFKNLVFDGTNVERNNNKIFEIHNACTEVSFTDCTIQNFNCPRLVFCGKNTTLTNVKVLGSTVPQGEVFVAKNSNNVKVAGTADYTLAYESNNAITALEGFEGRIELMPQYAAGAVLVKGCDNPALFSLVDAPEGYSLSANDSGNLELIFEKMIIRNETTGEEYSSFNAAFAAASKNDVLVVLEDADITVRIGADSKSVTVRGANEGIVLKRTFASGNNQFLFESNGATLTFKNLIFDCGNIDFKTAPVFNIKKGGLNLTDVVIRNVNSSKGIIYTGGTLKLNNATVENIHEGTPGIELNAKLELNGNNNIPVSSMTGAASISVAENGALTNETPISITLPNPTVGATVVSNTTAYEKFALTNNGFYLKPDEAANSVVVSDEVFTGIDDVVVDLNAPVEYYNLQGVRVANPETGGLYIRRQGSKVTKVIVK